MAEPRSQTLSGVQAVSDTNFPAFNPNAYGTRATTLRQRRSRAETLRRSLLERDPTAKSEGRQLAESVGVPIQVPRSRFDAERDVLGVGRQHKYSRGVAWRR